LKKYSHKKNTRKKYNWGILAPGRIAHKFAGDLKLLPNANLYAVGSRSLKRAQDFSELYGCEKAYGSYEELASDPAVDVIYIASPHLKHYPDTLLCLENGKAVLCEKPVAMNKKQFRVMIDAAQRNNVFLMEALWTRFVPSFNKFKELVRAGAIGEVKIIESDFCFKAPYTPEGRLFNQMLGGGSLLDIGIYPVFMAITMAGIPDSIKSIAQIGDTNVDESCTIILHHAKGILSVLYCSVVTKGPTQTTIYGSEGSIRLNTMWHMPTSIDLMINNKKTKHFKFREQGNGYQYEADEVMKCLDEGKIASDIFSWKCSDELISTLDEIRNLSGIHYPKEIESV
jgi:predicted dehydrogenase